MKKTKLVQKWRPGDRVGSLYFVSSRSGDYRLSRFCSSAEVAGVARKFVHPIPERDRSSLEVSVGIELYAEHGGHKRVVVGRWSPTGEDSLEFFVQQCKVEASRYNSVYPPNESVEVPFEPETRS